MALPGLQLTNLPAFDDEKYSTVHDLHPGSEWRFEVAFGDVVDVKVLAHSSGMLPLLIANNLIASIWYCGIIWYRACFKSSLQLQWAEGRGVHMAWLSARGNRQMPSRLHCRRNPDG